MTRHVALRPEAEREIAEAAAWYEERVPELGAAFLDEVARLIESIRSHPHRFAAIQGEICKAVLRRFPYIVLFRARADEVVVLSVFHTRRDPGRLRSRLR